MTELAPISPRSGTEPFGALQLGPAYAPPFDPREHVFIRDIDVGEQIPNGNIIIPPVEVIRGRAIGELVLRLYPRPSYRKDEPGARNRVRRTPEDLEQQVSKAETHFSLLGSIGGITIPPDRLYGAGNNPYHDDDTILYTYTNTVAGEALRMRDPAHEPWRIRMVETLVDYITAVKEQGHTHFLGDASKVGQYTVGRFANDTNAQEQLIMHDIDPTLTPLMENGRESDEYVGFMIMLSLAYKSITSSAALSQATRTKYQSLSAGKLWA